MASIWCGKLQVCDISLPLWKHGWVSFPSGPQSPPMDLRVQTRGAVFDLDSTGALGSVTEGEDNRDTEQPESGSPGPCQPEQVHTDLSQLSFSLYLKHSPHWPQLSCCAHCTHSAPHRPHLGCTSTQALDPLTQAHLYPTHLILSSSSLASESTHLSFP